MVQYRRGDSIPLKHRRKRKPKLGNIDIPVELSNGPHRVVIDYDIYGISSKPDDPVGLIFVCNNKKCQCGTIEEMDSLMHETFHELGFREKRAIFLADNLSKVLWKVGYRR